MAGAHVRLWTYFRDQTELVPFWGSSKAGEWAQYKDVGDDRAGQEIEYWFGQMKILPPTPHAGQSSETYGTSKGYSKAPGTTQPRISDWSKWAWDEGHECEVRYRQNSAEQGGYEYEYRTAKPGYEAGPSTLGSGYTVTYPIREAPSPGETEAKAEEHYPAVPDDAIPVEVKLEARDSGDLYHFNHDGQPYAKEIGEWEERTVTVKGKRYECFLYSGKKTGKHFYTYSLNNLEPYEPGKGKEKRKKGKGKGRA